MKIAQTRSARARYVPLLVVAVLTAAIAAACKPEADSDIPPRYTVSFDIQGGPNDQIITRGGKVTKPSDPVKLNAAGLYTGDIPAQAEFAGWYNKNDLWDFDTSVVTGNLTLEASWKDVSGSMINLSVAAGENIVDNTVEYINKNAGTYTLLLGADVELAPQSNSNVARTLNVANVKLTLIGLDTERKLTLTGSGNYGTMFTVSVAGAELTLGNNITLAGYVTNGGTMVRAFGKGAFTMLDGSKITGNTFTGSGSLAEGAAVVILDGGVFTMRGGTITGNVNSNTSAGRQVGGVSVGSGGSVFNMEGGSVSGNSGACGDIFVDVAGDFTLSGNAKAGSITLNASNAKNHSSVQVAAGWTGDVTVLNLRGNKGNLEANANFYADQAVIKGAGDYTLVNNDVNNKFALGNVIATSGTSWPLTGYYLGGSGDDIGKLKKQAE